jgi:hypothetical protein
MFENVFMDKGDGWSWAGRRSRRFDSANGDATAPFERAPSPFLSAAARCA